MEKHYNEDGEWTGTTFTSEELDAHIEKWCLECYGLPYRQAKRIAWTDNWRSTMATGELEALLSLAGRSDEYFRLKYPK